MVLGSSFPYDTCAFHDASYLITLYLYNGTTCWEFFKYTLTKTGDHCTQYSFGTPQTTVRLIGYPSYVENPFCYIPLIEMEVLS